MKLPYDAIKGARNNGEMAVSEAVSTEITDEEAVIEYGNFADIESLKDDTKAKIKYIKYLEKMARGSQELRWYINFLKENTDMEKCRIISGVSSTEASIELHHFPFSLFDITRIILDDALANEENISSFELIGRVVKEHYAGNIGLIPLCSTAHELAHAGKITLSLVSVKGNWKNFVDKYWKSLWEDDIKSLKFLINASSNKGLEQENFRKLRIKRRFIITEKKEES